MKELDFEKVNPELAEVVLSVAEECDSRYCDRMVIKMPPIKLKLIVDGHEIEISNEEELEREEKERNTLKDKIRSFIKNDPQIGYIKAYELCGDIDNELTRRIRYYCYKKISFLSCWQKIEICKKYADIKKIDEQRILEEITQLQYDMVKNNEDFDALEIFRTYRKTYELCEDDYCKNRMRWLYQNRKMNDGVCYWGKIFLPVFEGVYDSNFGFWGEYVFDILINQKEYDRAERFLAKWEKNELSTTPSEDIMFNTELCFIESNKQRLPFLRVGHQFPDSYEKVIFYDCLSVFENNKEKVALIKRKYRKLIQQYREYLTRQRVFYSIDTINGVNTYSNEYLVVSEEIIAIFPSIVSYINEISKYASFDDRYEKIPGSYIFKTLSIYYQKQNRFDDAIRICEKAIECGCIDDGTKSGMYGRLERLQKKLNKNH